jgi:hypothetical protein
MARRRKGELPGYRLHKQSGHAVVSLPLGGGKYRDFLLGHFDSEESKREYTRVINEWLAAGILASPTAAGGRCLDLSVAEVCVRLCKHADVHYRLVDGSLFGEKDNCQYAQAPLMDLYGLTPAKALSRREINRRIDRIKRMFKWPTRKNSSRPRCATLS